ASFTNDQIEAAVHAGQYSDPDAERMLIQIMEQRRDRIADYWFRQVAPLDRFRFTSGGLTFDDLAIENNLDTADHVKYEIHIDGVKVTNVSQNASVVSVPIMVSDSPLKVRIKRLSPNWRELEVVVVVGSVNGKPAVVGIQRWIPRRNDEKAHCSLVGIRPAVFRLARSVGSGCPLILHANFSFVFPRDGLGHFLVPEPRLRQVEPLANPAHQYVREKSLP